MIILGSLSYLYLDEYFYYYWFAVIRIHYWKKQFWKNLNYPGHYYCYYFIHLKKKIWFKFIIIGQIIINFKVLNFFINNYFSFFKPLIFIPIFSRVYYYYFFDFLTKFLLNMNEKYHAFLDLHKYFLPTHF
jgi:hypothetical protein